MRFLKSATAIIVCVFIFGCSAENSEQKMFEIANRQMEFNEFKVKRINDLVGKMPTNEVNKTIIENCDEFHGKITEFQGRLASSAQIGEVRNEINDYLNEYLQKVNPELNHENYLDGAISKGLLSIELAYVEKSFLEDQEFRIQHLPAEFDQVEVLLVPEKSVVNNGESVRVQVLLAASAAGSEKYIQLRYQEGGATKEVAGGVFEITANSDQSGVTPQQLQVQVDVADSTYTPTLNYWVIK